jgi:ATP-dependent Clp protease ATP-binding subunit ClpB
MAFDTNRLTQKSQEAIIQANNIAEQKKNSLIEPEHLLLALLEQEEGVVPQILQKLNISSNAIITEVKTSINKFPSITGSAAQIMYSQRTRTVIVAAQDEMEPFGDEYDSTEHLLLAILAKAQGDAERILNMPALPGSSSACFKRNSWISKGYRTESGKHLCRIGAIWQKSGNLGSTRQA